MPDRTYCTQCGQPVDASDTFCKSCGANLRQPTPGVPVNNVAQPFTNPAPYQQPATAVNPPRPLDSIQTSSPPQPLYPSPSAMQTPYPPQAYSTPVPYNAAGSTYSSYAQQQTGMDNNTIALAVFGFILAFVSLLFFPVFAGPGAIACGVKVKQRSNVLGIVLIVVGVIFMTIGVVFGMIVGFQRFSH